MEQKISLAGYQNIFQHSSAPSLIIGTDAPTYTILDANLAYLRATNSTAESLIGKSVFAAFPANPTDNVSRNIERTIFSFEQAILTREPHLMENYRYDIPIPGTGDFEERYWTTVNIPILDDEGEVSYFIHSPSNVTELVQLAEREKQNLDLISRQQHQLYSTFMQAPVGIAILLGPEYILELINPTLCELYDLNFDEVIGKPVFSVLTLAANQGFQELLDGVRLTGQSYRGVGVPATMKRNGVVEDIFLNFTYEPFRNEQGEITGVIAVVTEVTEQTNARFQVEAAEERARLAVDAVGLGLFDVDLRTGNLVSSPQFDKIFGFDHPVPYGHYIAAIHQDDHLVRANAHSEALVNGKLWYEARVAKPGEALRWIRAEGRVFFDESNKPLRLLGTVLDITAERKSLEEQRKLITLVDNCVDLMSILDLNGVNSYINDAGRQMLGFLSEEDVVNTPISDLHTKEDYEKVQQEVLPSVINHGRWSGTMMVKHLYSGEIFPVFNNCIRIDDPVSGTPIAVGAVMRDLRPELTAKKALADSERLLRNITTAAPITLWMTNASLQMIYINQTWMTWTGRSYEENLGTGWQSALHPEDRPRVLGRFTNSPAGNHFHDIEFRLNHVDGTVHWCAASGQPQYDDKGSFTGYIGACVDITDQKSLQQQKDNFIGVASHELKTPVTSIKGYTQLLEQMLQQKGLDVESGMMAKLDKQVNRLTNLISDLLDVTRINAGKLEFDDTVVDFNIMVKDLVEDLQRTTIKHVLVEEYQPTGFVYADRERLGQVITNFVSNAIKYSPAADQVIIRTYLRDNNVVLCVKDFGIGIAQGNLERVFEQFYRVSGSIEHSFPGLGIGLFISAEIIKREGGSIWVTSEEGRGSNFCFSLPLLEQ